MKYYADNLFVTPKAKVTSPDGKDAFVENKDRYEDVHELHELRNGFPRL